MVVTIINGSARGAKGVTHRLLDAFAAGLRESGAAVRTHDLSGLEIDHCRSCFSCMHRNPGVCVIRDGMDSLYPDFKSSDALVVGTPVYTDSMSSRMKAVFDRCICAMEPYVHTDDRGRFRHSFTWRMPREFVLVSTSGFPEPENFNALVATIDAQAYNFGSTRAATILVPGSLALQMEPTLLDGHLALLREAGADYGRERRIASGLVERINRPILSGDEFRRHYLRYEEWCDKRLGKKELRRDRD